MKPLKSLTSVVVPLDIVNIDTDAIIPKYFVNGIERRDLSKHLFHEWRYLENGEKSPNFNLNLPQYKDASILLSRANFGCGSSREHAPWALKDYGIQILIAPSFADIFYNNCFKNGILPICLSEKKVNQLFLNTSTIYKYSLTVNLEKTLIFDNYTFKETFELDPFYKQYLLQGLDDISLTLKYTSKIFNYEQKNKKYLTFNFD